MNVRLAAAALAAFQILVSSNPIFAQDGALQSRSEKRQYHACIYSHWIDGYCRFAAWGATNWTFRDCVIANGGCECAGSWGPDIVDACQALYRPYRR